MNLKLSTIPAVSLPCTWEPTPYLIKGIAILDNDGNRILAKYYDKDVLPTLKDQKSFEKNLFAKTHRANAEIIMLDRLTCVYRSNVDLFFYVMGSTYDNELILTSVLQCLYESLSHVLRKNVEKKVILENLDIVMLVLDEICDKGIILEADSTAVIQKVALRTDDIPLGEQTVAQMYVSYERNQGHQIWELMRILIQQQSLHQWSEVNKLIKLNYKHKNNILDKVFQSAKDQIKWSLLK